MSGLPLGTHDKALGRSVHRADMGGTFTAGTQEPAPHGGTGHVDKGRRKSAGLERVRALLFFGGEMWDGWNFCRGVCVVEGKG